jgi:hypothetical protein
MRSLNASRSDVRMPRAAAPSASWILLLFLLTVSVLLGSGPPCYTGSRVAPRRQSRSTSGRGERAQRLGRRGGNSHTSSFARNGRRAVRGGSRFTRQCDDIWLGARATETEIKRLSETGELYRIDFATHGSLAGQVSGNSEPGLFLTPPEKTTETDDCYLSASEIAALKLDADWVILSAGNTAAGGTERAEAFSGLGRAFFYAGSRALLDSHWAVYSDAKVKLITGAIGRMSAGRRAGRAEAMRQSMLALHGR